MNSTTYLMLGVMSGTSLDGVDLAYVRFTKTQNWEYELLACETVAYDEDWVARLRDAVAFSKDELVDLDREYTAYLAQLIQDFSARNPLKHIDAIASHGHTILHQPAKALGELQATIPADDAIHRCGLEQFSAALNVEEFLYLPFFH